jgi:hypothetical protein
MLGRYMQPATPHFVLTLDASVVHGSHFYCTSTLSRTLGSRFVDRTADACTNADHLINEVWIHALLAAEYHRLCLSKDPQELVDRPNADQLASLVVMSMHPQWFIPKVYSKVEKASVNNIVGLTSSRDKAKKAAALMLELAEQRCKEGHPDEQYLAHFLTQVHSQEAWLTETWKTCVIDINESNSDSTQETGSDSTQEPGSEDDS